MHLWATLECFLHKFILSKVFPVQYYTRVSIYSPPLSLPDFLKVRRYRQHWWRCNGPCRDRAPFHGWVKRAMNRAPSPRDRWWAEHQMTCGGSYTKVKEPEGYGKKTEKTKKVKVEGNEKKVSKKVKTSSKDIKEMLTGKVRGEEESRKSSKGKKKQSSPNNSVDTKVFSGLGHTLRNRPALSDTRQPSSQSERRRRLLEAVEKRQQVAQSKGMKRKSGGRLSGDFYATSPSQNQKRLKLEDFDSSTNGAVASSASNLSSSSRDPPPEYHSSLPGPSPSSTPQATPHYEEESEDECAVVDPDSDVVLISDDDEGGKSNSGDGGNVPVGMCPVCGRTDIPHDVINSHVTLCLEEDDQQDPAY